MSDVGSAELKLRFVGAIEGTFVVPAYQRGYRWDRMQVQQLLDDLRESIGRNYCLQPVVVRRSVDGVFELIDGQQRLTTLLLLYRHVKKHWLPNNPIGFSLSYETRPESARYFEEPDGVPSDDNIDLFHLAEARACIAAWFKALGNDAQEVAIDLTQALKKRVQVIWYEVGDDVDARTLFARLNVGRIPLTNAELVKALFLARRAAGDEPERLRQLEIAGQWDDMERRLHDPRFWAFLTNASSAAYPTRIELLFDLIAGPPVDKKNGFHTFFHFRDRLAPGSGRSAREVWREITDLFALLDEWHEDRNLFHKIGYLIADGARLADLVVDSRDKTKRAFARTLDARIRSRLALGEAAIRDLSYDDDGGKGRCQRALLLHNVETVRRLAHSTDRFPFEEHKRNAWSLEHIHAQNAEALVRKEQWQAWLRQHRDALASIDLDGPNATESAALVAEIAASIDSIDGESFNRLAPRVAALLSDARAADSVHSISNLALLPREINSELNNAVFEVKRQRILARDRAGDYVPISTRKAFLKYYSDAKDQQPHLWSVEDQRAYLDDIVATLAPYLSSAPGSAS